MDFGREVEADFAALVLMLILSSLFFRLKELPDLHNLATVNHLIQKLLSKLCHGC
jgi:hypothetical protein